MSPRAAVTAAVCLAFEIGFFVWLVQAEHLPSFDGTPLLNIANALVAASIALMELLRLINVISLAIASVTIRNPVPVVAKPGLRVAFATTIVPSKEPIEIVRRTLETARALTYDGLVDLWLLDEGDDPRVKTMCRQLNVRHFTRNAVERWNQPSGAFKTRTKHGNYNAWLDAHGDEYDVIASVDPDHQPMPNYLERMLGYFRDPDVAYVVGPQNYANCDNFVTAAAESQQFPFHAIIQRAANRADCAMLVGTNNAFRISALKRIGGLRDSVTEDMATGLQFHTQRNPETGRRWKSVYTPDVLAHGEGPNTWTDYFSQQLRWSRGTFEVLRSDFWRLVWRLHPRQLLHYGLIMTFYPSMAAGWLLGAFNSVLFLIVGATGIHVPVALWLALYADATALQLLLYFSGRRHNVSPYEPEGSSGIVGMFMSVLAAPLYASSLISTVLHRPARFVVTPKGSSSTADRLMTFRWHLVWAAVLSLSLGFSALRAHVSPLVCFWPCMAIVICLVPVVAWRLNLRPQAETTTAASAGAQAGPAPANAAPRIVLHADRDVPALVPAALVESGAS
jgi:cellulose synthase/poly-beta-1,6-N-acetylglucosamine synthase-like glycosyltransferase